MKLHGRPKVHIDCPKNYPLVMFDIIDRSTNETIRTVAKNARTARRQLRIKSAITKTTSPSEVLDELGHQGANDFLRQFGPSWVVKEGRIFYGELTTN